ncbi:type VI secretion protein [Pandoraea cepalis]|uniref:Type VI secretion protein n=1 Tax=Pandoraea cepalis TaxID=2508294 RepID=A0AAW7MGK1_9BURK|nr:TrbC family F-type conjugative pilus assembly protein [Pandoraea cepalis]MDN4571862.1 type VI secretion protein [Pandoraea cepalis]MDN4581316.1 type VI secretion protein [Pandoraea cepalis]
MKKLLALSVLILAAMSAHSQQTEAPLLQSITATWNTFIFISSGMPQQSVLALAREASLSRSVIVLTGFSGSEPTLTSTQAYAAEINRICCEKRPARWIVDPVLTRRYQVKGAPTFVVARGSGESESDFAKVSGNISLAQALKFVAQDSKIQSAREYARSVYTATYGNKF